MIKYLLLLLPLLSFGQPTKNVVVLDSIQAKRILFDLNNCDLCKEDIKLVSNILEKTEIKNELKDQIIDIMLSEAKARMEINQNLKDINAKSELQIKEYEKIIKKERNKKNLYKYGGLAVGLVTGYLLAK